jgi:hypothetical protein
MLAPSYTFYAACASIGRHSDNGSSSSTNTSELYMALQCAKRRVWYMVFDLWHSKAKEWRCYTGLSIDVLATLHMAKTR